MVQREWLVQLVVRASEEEVDAIRTRIGEAVCVPSDHDGPCATPWTMSTSLVADHDEPRRSELKALLED